LCPKTGACMKCFSPAGDVLSESYSTLISWLRSARGRTDGRFSSQVRCAMFRGELQG
ncbi:hypothetical protein GX50_08803, partial [[Emmonsia] crescens]